MWLLQDRRARHGGHATVAAAQYLNASLGDGVRVGRVVQGVRRLSRSPFHAPSPGAACGVGKRWRSCPAARHPRLGRGEEYDVFFSSNGVGAVHLASAPLRSARRLRSFTGCRCSAVGLEPRPSSPLPSCDRCDLQAIAVDLVRPGGSTRDRSPPGTRSRAEAGVLPGYLPCLRQGAMTPVIVTVYFAHRCGSMSRHAYRVYEIRRFHRAAGMG